MNKTVQLKSPVGYGLAEFTTRLGLKQSHTFCNQVFFAYNRIRIRRENPTCVYVCVSVQMCVCTLINCEEPFLKDGTP